MKAQLLTACLWAANAALLGAAWCQAKPLLSSERRESRGAALLPTRAIDEAMLGAAASVLESVDPFHTKILAMQSATGAAAPSPPLALPILDLYGIVGGPPWSAIVARWTTTQTSTLVQPGDTAQGVLVVRVGADHVVLRRADTTWTLRLAPVTP